MRILLIQSDFKIMYSSDLYICHSAHPTLVHGKHHFYDTIRQCISKVLVQWTCAACSKTLLLDVIILTDHQSYGLRYSF